MRAQRRGVWKLLTLFVVLGLVLSACGGDDPDEEGGSTGTTEPAEEKKSGGTVILAAEQEPESLNWLTAAHNSAWGRYIMGLVWPGTWNAGPDGKKEINKDLVTSAELTSEDPQTVVYKINPDAVWSDGKAISADDFIFYWEAQSGQNEAYLPAGTTGYEDVESVVGSDGGKTVTVTFKKKFADWDGMWDYLLPVHAFAAAGGGDKIKGFNQGYVTETLDLTKTPVVSGGPYQITEYTKGQGATLVKNDKYWGEDWESYLDQISIRFITDATAQAPAMENKEADISFPQAQIDLVQQLKAIPGITSEIGFGTFWEHLDMNNENQHLAVKEVRLAIAKALDRPAIVERLPGQFSDDAQVLNNRIYKPGHADYVDHGKEYAEQDVEAAAELLEKAGYAKGADGIYAKGGNKLSLRIVWRDPNERRQQTAELIQAQLKEAGIETQLAPQPNFLFLDEGNFDIALFGWTGGTVLSGQTSIYVPDGGQNFANHKNPKLKEMFDAANVELDAEARADMMNEIDELLWEDMPTVPLFQVPEVLVWRDTIDGPAYNGYTGPTWNAFDWSLK